MKTDKLVQKILNNHINNDGEITEEGFEIVDMEIQHYLCEILSPNCSEYYHAFDGRFDGIVDTIYMLYNDRKENK